VTAAFNSPAASCSESLISGPMLRTATADAGSIGGRARACGCGGWF
jgi:hypothetical protein